MRRSRGAEGPVAGGWLDVSAACVGEDGSLVAVVGLCISALAVLPFRAVSKGAVG